MKLSIERATLLKALAQAQSVVERRNTIPILANVLIEAEGNQVSFRATDLDIEVVDRAPAMVERAGATTVSAVMLHEIVRKLPDGALVNLTEDAASGRLTIMAGRSTFSLATLPKEDFPVMATSEYSSNFSAKAPDLRRLFDKAKFAISTEETRYYLNGVYMHVSQGETGKVLRCVATDGHRLARIDAALPGQGAFQHADVGGDPVREEFQHAIGQHQPAILAAVMVDLLLQDAKPKLIIRWVQVDDQPALQARLDAVLKILDLARSAVGGNDDLLVRVDQGVERVEEFFLGRIFPGDELHVIDHQHVDRPEQFLEIHHLPVAQGLDEAVHELLGGQIQHAQLGAADLQLMRDGMHQVGLPQTDAAIQEKRVEADGPALGHPAGGGMGQLVRLADDETVEGEAGIQRRARQVFVRRPRAGGFGGRLGGGTRLGGRSPHREFDAVHGGPGAGQLRADVIAVVALDPVAEEDRRHLEAGDAVFQLRQLQRFDPGGVVVLTDPFDQLFPNLPPGFIRHSLTCQYTSRCNPALPCSVVERATPTKPPEGRLRHTGTPACLRDGTTHTKPAGRPAVLPRVVGQLECRLQLFDRKWKTQILRRGRRPIRAADFPLRPFLSPKTK